jgi:hypothetical protein
MKERRRALGPAAFSYQQLGRTRRGSDAGSIADDQVQVDRETMIIARPENATHGPASVGELGGQGVERLGQAPERE